MLKNSILIICLLATGVCTAQKFAAKESKVTFFSDAAIEDITADNTKSSGIFDPGAAAIALSIPIKDFIFAKALMQEHFNEKYMETDKFPKATFTGNVKGYDPEKAGAQNVNATGKLTIHGVTREVEVPGTLEKVDGKLQMKSKFIVKLADYKIAIPQIMWQKIAEQVEVTLDFKFAAQ